MHPIRIDLTNPADPHVIIAGEDHAANITALAVDYTDAATPTVTIQFRAAAIIDATADLYRAVPATDTLGDLDPERIRAHAEQICGGIGGDYTAAVIAAIQAAVEAGP